MPAGPGDLGLESEAVAPPVPSHSRGFINIRCVHVSALGHAERASIAEQRNSRYFAAEYSPRES
jgi:hypothetical protein